jgi:[protein-PII] uridylyltransferase
MIITLADGMGTSDEKWSDWKELMVWNLYHQTRKLLTDSAGFHEERIRRREELRKQVSKLMPENFAEEIEAQFSNMPERYLQSKEATEICGHIMLFHRFFEEGLHNEGSNLNPVVEWIDHQEDGHSEVLVCGWDRERLLERIAAAFLFAGINVMSADIFTRSDNLALDIFKVSNYRSDPIPKERERKQFEQKLGELLISPGSRVVPVPIKQQQPTESSVQEDHPVWVVVNNNAHPTCTILEVQAPDRLGLLYRMLRAISPGGTSIDSARIATEQKAALDVFYLRTKDGGKITDRKVQLRLERRLRTAAALSGEHR